VTFFLSLRSALPMSCLSPFFVYLHPDKTQESFFFFSRLQISSCLFLFSPGGWRAKGCYLFRSLSKSAFTTQCTLLFATYGSSPTSSPVS